MPVSLPWVERHLSSFCLINKLSSRATCRHTFPLRGVPDRKKAEAALRESEDRFRTLIEQASDAFFLHDSDGRFLEVNRQACESLGYTREEMLGMPVFDVD